MFDQLVKRSNSVWIYRTARFAEERRTFLCDLRERGHDVRTLRHANKLLLVIAERVNMRQRMPITEVQIRAGSQRLDREVSHAEFHSQNVRERNEKVHLCG